MPSWGLNPEHRHPRARYAERVSIVMATFNGAPYLSEQLESLRWQSRWPDEVIIVDDSSSDDTVAMARAFARTAPFPVDVIVQSGHRGTCQTFEEGLRRASGDIILICDQDDIWRSEKVAVMTERMAERPDALLAFSDAVLVNSEGERMSRSRWRVSGFGPRQQAAMTEDPLGQLIARQIVSGCTAAIRSELIPAILPFPAEVHPALGDMMYDRWFSLVAAAAAPVVTINERLVEYRIHPKQQIGIPALPLRRLAPQTTLRAGQFLANRPERIGRSQYHRAHLEEIAKRLAVADLDSGESALRIRMATEHLLTRELVASEKLPTETAGRHYLDDDGYRRFALGLSTALADWLR